MLKQVRSWSKDETYNLIGSKQVDWSIFRIGTHIPYDFHEEFMVANDYHQLKVNEEATVKLIINDVAYPARLVFLRRNDGDQGSLQLRYDQNENLKELLRDVFSITYNYLKENRED